MHILLDVFIILAIFDVYEGNPNGFRGHYDLIIAIFGGIEL